MIPTRLRVPAHALAAACLLAGRGEAVPAPGDSNTTAVSDAASRLRANVRIDTRTSPDSLTVGDHMTLEVFVDAPPGCEVRFPDRVEPGGSVDLVDHQVIPPKNTPHKQGELVALPSETWIGRYERSVFHVGDVVLPPWSVEVRQDGQSIIASSDSIRIFVHSVLTDSLRQAGLQDLASQVKLASFPWLYVAIGAVALALVLLGVWLWWRRRHRRAVVVPIARVRPAHEQALEALRKLESRHLPVDGKFEEYYVHLSEIFRRYLEDGFGVAALEETTEEILFDLDRHGFDRVTVKQVGALCNDSDLVKFAKHEPTIAGCQQSIEHVRDFVVATAARSAVSQSRPVTMGTGTSGASTIEPAAVGTGAPGAAGADGGTGVEGA
jgi:hypothetical protein